MQAPEEQSIFSQSTDSLSFNPMGIAAQALGANSSNDEGPPLNFTHNQGDSTTNSQNMVLEMLNSSF
jgi:hypothetical protein